MSATGQGAIRVAHVGRYIRPPWVEGVANAVRDHLIAPLPGVESMLVSIVHADHAAPPFHHAVRYIRSRIRSGDERRRHHAWRVRMEDLMLSNTVVDELRAQPLPPQIIHIHNASHWAIARAVRKASWPDRPVVIAHHYGAGGEQSKLLRAIGGRIGRSDVDAHFCSSPLARDALVRRGVPSRQIFLTPPPVDLDVFTPRATTSAADRQRIVYIGNLSEDRFPLELMVGVARLAAARAADLRIVTSTREVNTRHFERAQAALPDPSAQLLRKDLSPQEKSSILQDSTIFLLPFAKASAIDPPVSLIEAMGAGCAPLATDVQGVRHVIEDGKNGRLVPPRGPAFLDALDALLADPANTRTLGTRARASVHPRFAAQTVHSELSRLYHQLASEAIS